MPGILASSARAAVISSWALRERSLRGFRIATKIAPVTLPGPSGPDTPTPEKRPFSSGCASSHFSPSFTRSSVPSSEVPGGVSIITNTRPSSDGGKNSEPSSVPKTSAAANEATAIQSTVARWPSAQSSTRT